MLEQVSFQALWISVETTRRRERPMAMTAEELLLGGEATHVVELRAGVLFARR